jgi:hypothetical protein
VKLAALRSGRPRGDIRPAARSRPGASTTRDSLCGSRRAGDVITAVRPDAAGRAARGLAACTALRGIAVAEPRCTRIAQRHVAKQSRRSSATRW